jgi:DNA polymerase elongation subunit (family B)
MKCKNLFIDIETSPNIVASFQTGYNISIPHGNIIKERQILCAAWKFENGKVDGIKWDGKSDKKVVKACIDVMATADQIVGQNHRRFDLKWIRTRALHHRIPMPPVYKTVDTLTLFKRYFNFNSNRLDYVSKFLTGEGKLPTDMQLWLDILIKNDQKQLEYMFKYNKVDIAKTEEVYKIIRPYVESEMHVGVLNGNPKWTCSACGNYNVGHNKERITAQGTIRHTMQCKESKCGSYYTISDADYRNFLAQKNK